ncbi:MAG: hypothetical protein DRQ78_09195 [Epsilonproteobacteria bacterium]|nr:MAG: hypothetical protein DRQ78_09195 [Campylobacterota bacterium]
MIDKLLENSAYYMAMIEAPRKRYFYDYIDHSDKLIGLVGARGVGKTTYILHYLKNLDVPMKKKLYLSADDIMLSGEKLVEIAKIFSARGGQVLAIDEIHKYKNFEIDLKQIYDMLKIKVIFSGSSAIQLEHAKADLSRRAVVYRINGLSFREFLEFKKDIKLKIYTLKEILESHMDIAFDVKQKLNPLEFWDEYLQYGYYPFYFENPDKYSIKLQETINTVIEVDIPSVFKIKYEYIVNLKKLVKLICSSEPFKLNITEISAKIGIDRDTLYLYLEYLHRGKIFNVMRSSSKGDGIFTKPDKVYLNNPNLHHAYCEKTARGTIRESIFVALLQVEHQLSVPKKGDFLVNERYTFEVGGKSKGFKQIKNMPDSYVVSDEIESGFGNKIPLWLFGFLY